MANAADALGFGLGAVESSGVAKHSALASIVGNAIATFGSLLGAGVFGGGTFGAGAIVGGAVGGAIGGFVGAAVADAIDGRPFNAESDLGAAAVGAAGGLAGGLTGLGIGAAAGEVFGGAVESAAELGAGAEIGYGVGSAVGGPGAAAILDHESTDPTVSKEPQPSAAQPDLGTPNNSGPSGDQQQPTTGFAPQSQTYGPPEPAQQPTTGFAPQSQTYGPPEPAQQPTTGFAPQSQTYGPPEPAQQPTTGFAPQSQTYGPPEPAQQPTTGFAPQSQTYGPPDPEGDDEGSTTGVPIVLDLTGNGIDLTKLTSSNTYFDITGTGEKSLTAWAGVGNGVLFVDTSGAGQLTQANQVVFTDWDPTATSDLQALADVFDTNHDGKLDAGDADFADFFVMETNANGTQTAVSLASLGITSINLIANTVDQTLDDGSTIDGETTYTTSSGATRTVATVTFATDGQGHAVTTTDTANADGSETISSVALNTDGSVAYTRILNTSANGLVKTLSDLNAGGVVTSLQTDVTAVSGATTTDTVTNYANGAVTATGELTGSGTTGDDTLNSETTTTVTGSGSAKTVTILRDQTGGGWTSQSEVDTYNSAGLLASTVVSDLNPDGSASNVTTTTVSSDGLTRTVTSLVDGIAADSTTSVDATSFGTASGSSPAPETEVVTDSAGTTVTAKITTATTTTTGLVTRVITSDLTDGSTPNLTTTETTATSASGSTTTTIDVNANGSFRDESVSTVDPTGLLKTTKTDSTGLGTSAAPVFDAIETDNTVVNSDGSRTETITDTSANGTLRDQSVDQRFADGVSRNVSIDAKGDGLTKTTSTDVRGQASGAAISYDRVTIRKLPQRQLPPQLHRIRRNPIKRRDAA